MEKSEALIPSTKNKGPKSFGVLEGVAFLLVLLAVTVYVIAFATQGWQHYKDPNGLNPDQWVGLWQSCYCDSLYYYQDEGWFKAAQAFLSMGLIVAVVVLIMGLVYMFVSLPARLPMLVVMCVLSFVVVVFILVGVIVFGVFTGKYQWGGGHQSYSFILAIVGMAFTLAGGIVSIFQLMLPQRMY